MLQVLQSLSSGTTESVELPAPVVGPGMLLIRNHASVISSGTERMLVEFGRASMIQKARSQPDKVRQVIQKARTDGVAATVDAVRAKLDQPMPLGYSSAGEVLAVGDGVVGFRPGDRVASNGPHAGIVLVPANLCALIPEPRGERSGPVAYEEAAFAVLGAIGLQGVRLAQPTLGEVFAVTGLGLVGLLTARLLVLHGCTVIGSDFDPARLEIARAMGVHTVDLSRGEDPEEVARAVTRGRGLDGVLIAAATRESEPVLQAARMCRKRGRIVLVGVTGLELARDEFFKKELTFQVSCSYGPGRYDPAYEEQGHDYPFGFVRWTEQRNFEAVLDMIAAGKMDVRPLISHRYPVEAAADAYQLVADRAPHTAIVLEYGEESAAPTPVVRVGGRPAAAAGDVRVGFVGAGQFAVAILAPAFQHSGARLEAIASQRGVSARHLAGKAGFAKVANDVTALLDDPEVNTLVIATRHDTHADLAVRALEAGKHVFLEKPAALNAAELERLGAAVERAGTLLHVGFNRRWAPHVVELKKWLSGVGVPFHVSMVINAGAIPAEHWLQQPAVGGGRIVGEGCHFVDLARHLAGAPVERWSAHAVQVPTGAPADTVSITLSHTNGCVSTIQYLANGSKDFPKERVEVFAAGQVAVLDNFRTLTPVGWKGVRKLRSSRQDKGHRAGVGAFVQRVKDGGGPLIPWGEIEEVTRLTIDIAAAL